ncbi:MAG: hypothetical protein Q8L30_02760 [bacterium]|nr:hypothetical protein [bacterium]
MRGTALIVRSYTSKEEEVEDRAVRALKVARDAHKLTLTGGAPALNPITFLVPTDHDCGKTADAIREKVAEAALDRILVIEAYGHHSSEALNEAIFTLCDYQMARAVIISGKAASYLTEATLAAIDTAFAQGAKVVCVAVDELADIVCEGRVQNTFCAWDIPALVGVGVFDSKGGVEEIAPTAKLIKQYGPCVAVLTTGGGKLDILQSDTARVRHDEVMKTKGPRQLAEAERAGVDFEFLKAGIMPGYPRPVF